MHTDFSRMKHISHFVLEQEGLRPSQMTVRQARHILTHNLGGTITYHHKGDYLLSRTCMPVSPASRSSCSRARLRLRNSSSLSFVAAATNAADTCAWRGTLRKLVNACDPTPQAAPGLRHTAGLAPGLSHRCCLVSGQGQRDDDRDGGSACEIGCKLSHHNDK